ncbi:MAG: carbohydrate deacetylase [Bacillota bacterium]|jgi:predicted glycoside hydrolase/deacetylase ChbG (UPF0249 family)|nr:ChbG/HpnK family deacetylase [Bacillota bacterium]
MRKLIINADDFGLTPGINQAVMRAHREGILTSATLMAGGLAWQEAVALAAKTPTLGVGVHLTITALKPVLPPERVPSLVDAAGNFRRQFWRVLVWNNKEVEAEWRAQIQRLLEAGLEPTHLDSHHHIHLWPPLLAIACRLAREFGIPAVRAISPASFRLMPVPDIQRRIAARSWRQAEKCPLGRPATVAALEAAGETEESIAGYLHKLGSGIHELYAHPGIPGDGQLAAISSLTEKRIAETELLCSDSFKGAIDRAAIDVVSYKIFNEERV